MKKNIYKKQYGFSLIETLIAVSILMIAIAGPLSLVQAGLFSSNHLRNQVTAMYLAQEALEYVKNLRDANSYAHYDDSLLWLAGPDGVSLLTTCGGTGCYVDPHGTLPTLSGENAYVQAVGSSLSLHQHNDNSSVPPKFSYYGYTAGDAVTPYKRTVKITLVPNSNGDEVTVSVTMNWTDGAVARDYTVKTNLFNYQIGKKSN